MSYIAEHGFNHKIYRERLEREKQVYTYFVPGFDATHQQPAYAYLVASAAVHEQMIDAISKGYIPHFAVVVESGFGSPTDEVKTKMKELYGYDHDAEATKPNIKVDKTALRQMMLARRQASTADIHERAKEQLAQHIQTILAKHTGAIIAGYVAVNGEIDPHPALQMAQSLGHVISLPAIIPDSKQLQFREYRIGDILQTGAHNIPCPSQSASIVTPDIVLVPLVAFDKMGNRLGYGGGYYDVTLAALKAQNPDLLTIGLAYDFQVVDSLPTEAHDVKLDMIVTESGTKDLQ